MTLTAFLMRLSLGGFWAGEISFGLVSSETASPDSSRLRTLHRKLVFVSPDVACVARLTF